MPTLAGLNGRSLNADLSGGLDKLLKTFGTGPEREAKRKAEALKAEALGLANTLGQPTGEEGSAAAQAATSVAQQFPGGQAVPDAGTAGPTLQEKQKALVRLSAINPQMAAQLRQTIKLGDAQKSAAMALEVDKGLKMANLVGQAKTFQGKRQRLMQIAKTKAASGQDFGRALELANLPEEQLDLEIQKMKLAAADHKTILDDQTEVRQQVDAEGNPTGAQEKVTKDFLGRETVSAVEASGVPQKLEDIKNAEGDVIGQTNTVTGKKNFFTNAQRGIGGGGVPQSKEPIIIQMPVLKDGKPVLEDGVPKTKQAQQLTSFDPGAKKGEQWTTEIKDLQGIIISKSTGRSADASDAAAIKVAGQKTQAVQDVLLKTQGELEKIKKRSQNIETRLQGSIDEGLNAVKSLPNLRRTRELLNQVKTGGYARVKNALNRLAGTENANEAELNNSLGKTVLSQLKATFGSAFTAQEGQLLQDIEANFGKSTAGNVRLLDRAIKASDIRAQIGASAAKTAEDTNSIEVFKKFQNFSLDPTPGQDGKATAAPLKVGQSKNIGGVKITRTK